MLTNNNDTAKKIKNFDENYSIWVVFDRLKQFSADFLNMAADKNE